MSDLQPKTVRVFLAMPGTDLGPDAKWNRPDDVRAFFEKFRVALQEKLARPVDLIVEREKREAGLIHDSMFREALEADVFIADLTGHNPNVFFELGVRYALRRRVTIPVSQSTDRLPFNVEHARAVQYANRPDDFAIEQLVELVEHGLANEDSNDSPILSVLDLVSIDRTQWLHVSGRRRDALLRAAQQEAGFVARIRLLREAIETDQRSVDARVQLIQALRKNSSFVEAISEAEAAILVDPARAVFFHELGLCFGKLDKLEEAVTALQRALQLEPDDSDILANLGGVLRRVGMFGAPAEYDEEALRRALECYQRASGLDPHDTYPALNIVRLEFLLTPFDPTAADRAIEALDGLWHLCAFEATKNPADYWRGFDLADAQLLLGRADEGLDSYRRAIALVPAEEHSSILSSPLGPLDELLTADVLSADTHAGISRAKELLIEFIEKAKA